MAKYKVIEIEQGACLKCNVYIVEANSKEEAEENYKDGIFYDTWEDIEYDTFEVDPELIELIE